MINYRSTYIPNKYLIIGGGGTGSRLVPLLAQFLKTCAWILNPEITIVDDDVVEEKNLLRQNFIATDVGKPKATVLAQRYSRAFNIPIIPVVERVEAFRAMGTKPNMEAAFSRHINNSVVIMCVDSPEARRHILSNLLMYSQQGGRVRNIMLIDSGNENDFGQIVVSHLEKPDIDSLTARDLLTWPRGLPGDVDIPFIPLDMQYYVDMKAETTLSCADLDQTMAINSAMAIGIFGIIQNLIYAQPIKYTRLNITLGDGATPEYITGGYIARTRSYNQEKFSALYPNIPITALYPASMGGSLVDFNKLTVQPFLKNMEIAKADTELKAKRESEAKAKAMLEAVTETIRKQAISDYLKTQIANLETNGLPPEVSSKPVSPTKDLFKPFADKEAMTRKTAQVKIKTDINDNSNWEEIPELNLR